MKKQRTPSEGKISSSEKRDLDREKLNEKLNNFVSQTSFFNTLKTKVLPEFRNSEVRVGPLLGIGGFCNVYEIGGFVVDDGYIDRKKYDDLYERMLKHSDDDFDIFEILNKEETKFYMARNHLRQGEARYAVKRVREDIDGKFFFQGVIDLATESKFLSIISHPNIIKMRGTLLGDPIRNDFFLVLDRLQGTLEDKILGDWTIRRKSLPKACGCIGSSNQNPIASEFLLDRLLVAYDLSSAFRYLHQQNLIYRDIKSDNIGFDVRGDVKVFDFGLCREIPHNSNAKTRELLYKMTGRTGSTHYMAPEVFLCEPYNQKADIYSFGILLWEILALKPPFELFDDYDYLEKVVKKDYRPQVKDSPTYIKLLIKDCWSVNLKDRPDFFRVSSILRGGMRDIKVDRSIRIDNRTSHLMNMSTASAQKNFMTK